MIDRFLAERREQWQELERLLKRARRHPERLPAEDLEQMAGLYRHATSDLAIARRDFPHDRLTRYLEQLVGRAHPIVYRRAGRGWRELRDYFLRGFPQAYRRSGGYTALAFALLAIPFALVFLGTLINPGVARTILPDSPVVQGIEQGKSWLQIQRIDRGLESSLIMTNNIQVIFASFAGGVLFGAGTVFTLIYNGLGLGAVAGLATRHGLGRELGTFVLAHGGIELSVVFMAGGAGLRLGHALLAPGLATRREALTSAARQGSYLMLGSIPLLVIAGLFEGFVSPSGLPAIAKVAIGAFNLCWLYAYLLLAGRSNPHSRDRALTSR